MSSAQSLFDVTTRFASLPFRFGIGAGRLGKDLERRARGRIATAGEEALLATLDAVVDRLMRDQVIDRVLERAEVAGVAQRVADRILEDGIAEQIAERAFSGPELERIIGAAFRSALPEEVIAQLLASEAVWILVDEIARSPSVTQAISHQGTGFLDEVAVKARDRSRRGDVALQRLAERLSRHRRHGDGARTDEEGPLNRPLSTKGGQ
jgi:hypothetical protein